MRHLGGRYCLMSLNVPGTFPRPVPGQFAMVRTAGRYPLLGRPISIHDFRKQGRSAEIDFLFQEAGEGTALLASMKKGDNVIFWGPEGNGFELIPGGPQVLVAGGRGIAPIWFLARRMVENGCGADHPMELFYGAASAGEMHYIEEFRDLGFNVHVATMDGSKGRKGFITDSIMISIRKKSGAISGRPAFYACGPTGMLEKTHQISRAAGGVCQVSMESRMACGTGVCLGCAHFTSSGSLIHVCKEGPVMYSDKVFGGAA